MIIVDTLRADHLGCYGNTAIQTPCLDRLALEGTLYENVATAAPVTLPAIASILTGAYPVQHGIRDNGPFRLDERWTTLAECFRDAGWTTGAFVSAAVLSGRHELDQGFTIYDDDVSVPYVPQHPLIAPMRERIQGIERRAAVTVDRSLSWLKDRREENTFLLVHLFDPHLPYDPPAPFDARYRQDPYGGEIAYLDAEVGRLLHDVQEMSRESDLLVIVVADHGEGLGDHGEFYHGDLLFDETTRVPLIVKGRGVARGKRVREVVRTVDILPTICQLQGLELPDGCAGEPLPGLLRSGGDGDPRGRIAYLETFRPRMASNWCELRGLRTDDWKLIDGAACELYDLRHDPRETRNIAGELPAVRDSLLRRMDATALDAARVKLNHAASLDLSAEQRERLRSLGYITAAASRPAASDSLAVWGFPPKERGRVLGLPDSRERLAASSERIVANTFFQAGQALLAEGRFEEAAKSFRDAIRHDDGLSAAYFGLAASALRADRPDFATETLARAGRRFRGDASTVIAVADTLVRVGRPDIARKVVDEAIAAVGRANPLLRAKRAALARLKWPSPTLRTPGGAGGAGH